MGARGPLAMPDNVRQLRGNPGRRETPKSVAAVVAIPDAPTWDDDEAEEAQAEWDRITPEMERLQLLSRLDRAVLITHCRLFARFVTEPDAGSPRGIKLAETVRASCKELGLTPGSRLRMKAPEIEPPADPKTGLD